MNPKNIFLSEIAQKQKQILYDCTYKKDLE
jgi:hypothetical protein